MLGQIRRMLLNVLSSSEQHVRKYRKYRYLSSRRIPWSAGYSEFKYDFLGAYINSEALGDFKSGKLPQKYGYRMDERFVEYPWFFSRLKKEDVKILDAGSVLNFKQILAAEKLRDRKLYITTLFFEGRPEILPPPSYIYEDLRDLCFKDDFFDAICALSTVEHIGFDNTMLYTPDLSKRESDKYSYLKAMGELRRVLRKGGTVYMSVPFGRYKDHGWFQVFDSEMVDKIISVFNASKVEKTFFKYENDQWNFSDEASCSTGFSFDIHDEKKFTADYQAASQSVVCIEMVK